MPFSHHSHSGQFCAHAKNTLPEMIAAAVDKKISVFGLTEHMPRGDDDLYPEELKSGYDAQTLADQFADYLKEAQRLRNEHIRDAGALGNENATRLLIGFEAEWIRPEVSAAMVRTTLAQHDFDYFVGSVHHVHTVPIDYDRDLYEKARDVSGGSDAKLFGDYFDAQHEMLQMLKPKIVGHFDLIRLLSDEPDRNWQSFGGGGGGGGEVWSKVLRNLKAIVDNNGLLEINTSAWRKGLQEPYPRSEICLAFKCMGGCFVLSDDSHGVEHVATNYSKLPAFLRYIELDRVSYLDRDGDRVTTKSIDWNEFTEHEFWRGQKV